MNYRPRKEAEAALNYLREKIDKVPYKVSARWGFYRILQGLGYRKGDYKKFIRWESRARKNFWNGWAPDTFEDDTRQTYWSGGGYSNFKEWVDGRKNLTPIYNAIERQDRIVVCCYEARAMHQQFEHYVGRYRVSLIPFGGDPSIELKWRIAKEFEEMNEAYSLPIVVLYFGDFDEKGKMIPLSAFKDIRKWCSAPFEFVWCGLNQEQIKKFKLPRNPEKPKEYQWEALDDPQAKEILLGSLSKYWDLDTIDALKTEETKDAERWIKLLDQIKMD